MCELFKIELLEYELIIKYYMNYNIFLYSENLAIKNKVMKRERRNRRKIIDSDSDIQLLNSDTNIKSSVTSEDNKSSDSDTSVGKPKKMRKRKTYKSSDTDSSFTEKRYIFYN